LFTGYLNDPRASATGYNPWTYAQSDSGSDPTSSYYTSHGSLANEYQWGNALSYYWDAPTGNLIKAGQAGSSSPTPVGGTAAGYGAGSFGLNNQYNVHSQGYSGYANASNYFDPSTFPGANIGSVMYYDKTLSDPSIFDFYNKLIDGSNKHESQNWNAYNINLVQTLFQDRLSIQAVADHQEFSSGQEDWLDNTNIVLDLNSYNLTYPTWLPGMAQTNPNLGRPALYGGQGNGTKSKSTRDNYQVTASLDVDVERDFGVKGPLASILGHHDITALFGTYKDDQYQETYHLAGIDHAWNVAYNASPAAHLVENGFIWTAYLGPSLIGTTGVGANLPNLQYSLAPKPTNVTGFSNVWTAGWSDCKPHSG
jgi:hypothetical protein